ncbi:DUF6653 family protein [Rhodopseudomonas palustris]|uniref:DUF6653 family protein n=1 Tax=Rhodopseudomonas palustris TaxID=1076 RepID=UPI002ACEE381|nr:DUF6653 family protein [Rhodopseudomonas palustris]WQH01518.1 DUF6653 family protein [Rhodopseudomonas palustris]
MAVLSDETWKRHANPWSVWTRYAAFPVLIAAIWSRAWLGWWALAPIGLTIAWLAYNPRAFPPPASTDNWASKAVLGERIWVALQRDEVPAQHRIVPGVAAGISMAGLPFLAWGLIVFDLAVTALGMTIVMLAKTWFVDRMVWLFEDMKDQRPEYRSWLY